VCTVREIDSEIAYPIQSYGKPCASVLVVRLCSWFHTGSLASIALLILIAGIRADAQNSRPAAENSPRSGADLYRAGCAACHGLDGTGVPQSTLGFDDLGVPDFTDCAFGSVEPDGDWLAVTHDGGPARGFDRRMPAFGEALTEAEILRVLDHLRSFCGDPAWPRGELNLPRPLFTEKAFPENEAVFTTAISGGASSAVTEEILYEKRFGARNQYEVVVPLVVQESAGGGWHRGLGDVAFAVKRVLFHRLDTGTIVSAAGEAVLPTGKEALGLGKGVTIFEPFVAVGQMLPRNAFVQFQAGAELPFDRDRAEPEAFWRGAVGATLEQAGFGRAWSPMVEILGARELEAGQAVQWDAVPQIQVTLNQRQHLMVNAGVRIPLTGRDQGRRTQVVTYFLWDWFDGGLRDGW
jgi:mono/diheme cytochrome c family protein